MGDLPEPQRSRAGEIAFRRLSLTGFRNFERLVFEPCPRLNVIAGNNGQGKTSLLEALYYVATTRSFRSERMAALVRHGASEAWVKAQISEGSHAREQRAGIVRGARRITIDGKKPERLVAYAQRTPVVAFHPGDLELVSGPESLRRLLLDRVLLFIDAASYERKARYERAMKERKRALDERGERAPDLDAFETLAAQEGARLQTARGNAARELAVQLGPLFADLSHRTLGLDVRYVPGGTEDVGAFQRELQQRRHIDRIRLSATFGPGRDQLELAIDGRAARTHASQGQQRILTLALKLAELECIARARNLAPVLLLDDVSSELDPTRTGAVYSVLSNSQSQIFVTTTRPELFPTPSAHASERRDFVIVSGEIHGA
ncbi:MAG TPA: DNA replication and repair protein RecF [Polyangiaceae bacterium]|nr:DNA replication and repair protein RecF [Polyangiaceae bacterium]